MNKSSEPPREEHWLSKKDRQRGVVALFGVASLVLATVVVVRLPRDDLATWSSIAGGLGTLLVSVLGLIGAFWWWRQKASSRPRLKVTQSVSILPQVDSYIPLYVTAHLENVGEIPITLTKWCLWASELLPFPTEVVEFLDTKPNLACRDFHLPWRAAAGSEFEIPPGDAPRVFPGETQDIGALLRIRIDATWVRIYSFIPRDSRLQDMGRGWTSICILNVQEGGSPHAKLG